MRLPRTPLTVARLRVVSNNGEAAPRSSQPALRSKPPLPADRLYIPRVDVDALASVVHLPGKAWAVFLAIRFEVAVKKSRTIKLGNHILWKRWSVTSQVKRHGLQVLERAGHIRVDQQPGCSPVVTLLE
jgi:hypothetical protein